MKGNDLMARATALFALPWFLCMLAAGQNVISALVVGLLLGAGSVSLFLKMVERADR